MSTKQAINLSALPLPSLLETVRPAMNRYLLFGIIAIGGALRWMFSQSRGLTYDDAFSILLSSRTLGEIVSGTAADTMPPLYYFLLHGWMQITSEIWFLRSLNILVSLVIIGIVYRIARSIGGDTCGLWAAFVTAISPLQVYHAQDLRMYAILSLAQLGYIACFIEILQAPEKPAYRYLSWAGLVLCGAAALYSHNLAVVIMPVPFLYAAIKRNWVLFKSLTLGHLAIGVLAVPWLVQIPGQVSKIQTAFWTPVPGIVEVFQAVILFHSQLPLPGIWLVIAAVLSLQVLVLVAMEGWRLRKTHSRLWVLIGFLAIPPLTLLFLSYLMRPVFVTRAFLVSSLAYYLLMGWVLAQGRAAGKALISIGMVSLSIIGLVSLYTYHRFPRSPFESAMQYIQQISQGGDLTIHDNKLSYFPSYLYAPTLHQVFLRDEPGSTNDTLAATTQQALNMHPQVDMNKAVDGVSRIHFVVFEESVQEYIDAGFPAHPHLAWLEQHGKQAGVHSVDDLTVYTYVMNPPIDP
jgi:4-amino-4-deoxy-L-arabinose transferase-like glycosyltransferase